MLCTGDTLLLTALATGLNYTWTLPDGSTLTTQTITIPNATPANSGYYSLQYSSAFCTSILDSFYVAVNAIPAPTISPSVINLCSGDSAVLMVDSAFSSYHWYPGNQTTQSININSAGTFYAEVTQFGCTGTSNTATVSVYPTVPNPVAVDDTVCSGNDVTLTATSTGTLTWYDSTNTQVGTGSTFTTPILYYSATYYVQSVDANGCTSAMVPVNILVPPAFTAPVVSSNSPVCSGNSIMLTTPFIAGVIYSWTGPNSFTSSVQNPIIPNAQLINTGTYQLIISVAGCSSLSGSTVVTVIQTPVIPLITGNTTYCEDDTLYLSVVNPISTVSYHWASPTGSVTSDSSFVYYQPLHLLDGGNYLLTVTENGCTNDTTIFVVVKPKPLAVASSNGPVCVGDTLQLNGNAVSGGTYFWNGPNGFNSFSQFNIIFGATVAYSGIYNYITYKNGCYSDTASVSVTVNAYPVIDLGNDTAMCIGHTIVFTLPSWYNYLWFNGSTSNIYTATDSGLVYVYAYAGGCVTIDSVVVDDFHCCEHSPNFITPNGDGENDFLYFDVEGARALHCTVFDRWGRRVYEWDDVKGSWDGKRINGTEVDAGTYYYIVDITFVDEKQQSYKGFVQVLK